MAGIANKEFFGMKNENEGDPNDNDRLVENPTSSIVSEHDRDELVCSISPSDHSSEILLYVDNQNEGVQDLIRVALNQSMSTEELQQQLQEAATNITLQSLGEAHTIISMDKNRNGGPISVDDKSTLLHHSAGSLSGRRDSDNAHNLFHLASLSDTLTSDRDQSHETFMGSELDMSGIKSESLDDVEGTSIDDYIIANVNARQFESIPGGYKTIILVLIKYITIPLDLILIYLYTSMCCKPSTIKNVLPLGRCFIFPRLTQNVVITMLIWAWGILWYIHIDSSPNCYQVKFLKTHWNIIFQGHGQHARFPIQNVHTDKIMYI